MARTLDEVVRSAVDDGGVESAAIFVVRPGSAGLDLAAAAGVVGPALDALTAAVQNPDHPIAKTLHDDRPTFDVRPMAPGGPALRSHLPLISERDGRPIVVGVLAVAHDRAVSPSDRAALERLAAEAASATEP